MGLVDVSVIIPCYNEQEFIGQCLESIISNGYDNGKLEVLVIDGMSSDDTRRVLTEYINKYPFIRIIDNQDRDKPRALNIGIKESKGRIIIRMDAHCKYEKDYISKSVKYLETYDADNVGGIRKTLPRSNTVMAKALANAISNPFTAGTAFYRVGAKTRRWVDTVFGGCWRRDIFKKIGAFHESLTRGQDREFNFRLTQAGGRILLAPDIICYYFARDKLQDYVKWIFAAGLTPFYISRIMGQVIFSWRNLAPIIFLIGIISCLFIAMIYPAYAWISLTIILGYLLCCLLFAIPIARNEKEPWFLLVMPLIFFITHAVYGLGSIYGLIKKIETRKMWTKI